MVIMKRLTATLAAGATSITFTDAAINSNSVIEIYTSDMDAYPITQAQTAEHSVTVTFNEQQDPVSVLCLVNNTITLSQPEAASNVTYDNTDSGLVAENVQDAIDEMADDVDTVSSQISELITGEDITSSVIFPNATLVQGGVFRNGNICMIKCNIRITTEIGNNKALIQNIPKPLMANQVNAFIKMSPVRSSMWSPAVSKWHFQSFSNSAYILNATQTLTVGNIVDLDWTYIIDEA